MKERILAIVGAVALVVVAIVVRGVVTDGGGGSGSKGDKPVVACTPDLATVCAALVADGRIAADPPTLDLPAAASAEVDGRRVDGWITWDPAPGIANIDAPNEWGTSIPIGSSPLAVAELPNRAIDLGTGCGFASLEWDCIAQAPEAAAVGIGTGRTSEDLVRLYPIARSLVPDGGDFTQVSGSRLTELLQSTLNDVDRQPFARQLVVLKTKPGALNLVVGPKGALDAAGGLRVTTPRPSAAMVAVYVPRTGSSHTLSARSFESDRTAQALRDLGVAPGEGKLAPDSRAGELYAVRTEVGS